MKFPECDGSTSRTVRGWLRHIGRIVPHMPAGLNADDAIKKLMEATSRDDLANEYETFLNQAVNRNAVMHAAMRIHLATAFLSPDESAVLKEEARSMRQSQRDDMPKYNRRFAMAADYAFTLPRNAKTEEQLADWYMGSLTNGKVKDRAFGHDPRLVTLQAALQVTAEEWAQQRRC